MKSDKLIMKKQDIKKEPEQNIKQEAQIKKLQSEVEELTNKWKRALADYQNLEKRIKAEKYDFIKFAAKNFIEKLLSVVDDLEKAQTHLKDEGLGLTLKKLAELLAQEGVERIGTVGKEFDILTMEAVSVVLGVEDNQVLEELRAGYTMHGSVIRPAQVAVSKKK